MTTPAKSVEETANSSSLPQTKELLDNDVDQEDGLPQLTMEEVALHSEQRNCWVVIMDFVYDVTSFLSEHPGGWEVIMEKAGTDATYSFEGKGHSAAARQLLANYRIGQLVKSDRLEKG